QLWHHFQALETGIFKPNLRRGGVKEVELIKNAIKWPKLQGYTFYTFVLIIVGGRAIYAASTNWINDKDYVDGNVTVVANTKIMPYTTWIPFDYNESPLYELVFVFQIFATVVYGFYIGATDALICGFMMMIKSQFLIIKNSLDRLVAKAQSDEIEDADRIELLDEKSQKIAAKLTNECVFHHQELIAMCEKAEDTFCYLMLLQFLSSLLIVCFALFQLSTLSPSSVQFFSMVNYLLLMGFQLLCYCWHGNEVQLVSGLISSYAYDINWVILNESIKKSLILLMMRSQRPCYFTAGKFSLLSLETFMTIIRGGGSYFMFLRQMNS
ncbi:7tm 6 domain containing protein, partial [Asbolus verrucosus]